MKSIAMQFFDKFHEDIFSYIELSTHFNAIDIFLGLNFPLNIVFNARLCYVEGVISYHTLDEEKNNSKIGQFNQKRVFCSFWIKFFLDVFKIHINAYISFFLVVFAFCASKITSQIFFQQKVFLFNFFTFFAITLLFIKNLIHSQILKIVDFILSFPVCLLLLKFV